MGGGWLLLWWLSARGSVVGRLFQAQHAGVGDDLHRLESWQHETRQRNLRLSAFRSVAVCDMTEASRSTDAAPRPRTDADRSGETLFPVAFPLHTPFLAAHHLLRDAPSLTTVCARSLSTGERGQCASTDTHNTQPPVV
jgi:hypothetical protein